MQPFQVREIKMPMKEFVILHDDHSVEICMIFRQFLSKHKLSIHVLSFPLEIMFSCTHFVLITAQSPHIRSLVINQCTFTLPNNIGQIPVFFWLTGKSKANREAAAKITASQDSASLFQSNLNSVNNLDLEIADL